MEIPKSKHSVAAVYVFILCFLSNVQGVMCSSFVYTYWYFWFCVVAFFFAVVFIAGCCRQKHMAKTQVVAQPQTVVVHHNPPPPQHKPNLPPSYNGPGQYSDPAYPPPPGYSGTHMGMPNAPADPFQKAASGY